MAKVISKLSIQVGARADGVKKGMKDATRATQDFGRSAESSFAGATAKLGAFVAATVLAVGGLRSIASAFGDIDRIAKFADEVGFTTEQLASWRLGAELTGTSITTLEKGLQIFTRRLGEAKAGIGEGVKGFAALGLSAQALSQMNPADAFKEVAQAISELPTASERAAAAFAIFGRQGQELMTFLVSGKDGINDFEKQAKKLGITFSRDMARDVEEANDAMARMKFAAKGLTQTLAAALAPAIIVVSDMIQAAIRFMNSFDKSTLKLVVSLGAGVAAFLATVAAVLIVIKILGKVIAVFRNLAKAQILVKALSGPKGWLALAAGLAVAAGATAAVGKQFDKLEKNAKAAAASATKVSKAGEKIKTSFTEPSKEAAEAAKAAARETEKWAKIGERLTERFKTPFEKMKDQVNEAKEALKRGVITWKTYSAAINDAVDGFERAEGSTRRLAASVGNTSVGAAIRGTSQAVDAVARGKAAGAAVAARLEELKQKADRRQKTLQAINNNLQLNTRAIRDNQVKVRQNRIL